MHLESIRPLSRCRSPRCLDSLLQIDPRLLLPTAINHPLTGTTTTKARPHRPQRHALPRRGYCMRDAAAIMFGRGTPSPPPPSEPPDLPLLVVLQVLKEPTLVIRRLDISRRLLLAPRKNLSHAADDGRKRPEDRTRYSHEGCIRDAADGGAEWEGDGAEEDGPAPLGAREGRGLEGVAAFEDDEGLTRDGAKLDEEEEGVAVEVGEDVEGVVGSSAAGGGGLLGSSVRWEGGGWGGDNVLPLIEYLKHDVCVEDEGLVLIPVGVRGKVAVAAVVQGEDHDELVDGLPEDHLPHGGRHNVAAARVGLTLEDVVGWGVSRESGSGEDVHDEVEPEEMDHSKDG